MADTTADANPYASPTSRLHEESDSGGFSLRLVLFGMLAIWGTCATCAGMVELLAGVGTANSAAQVLPWESFPRPWLILSGTSAGVGGLLWIAAAGACYDRQVRPATVTALLGLPLHATSLCLNLIFL